LGKVEENIGKEYWMRRNRSDGMRKRNIGKRRRRTEERGEYNIRYNI
jgi:hypothetical protein